ncbi:MAG: iron-containing alcohol dehydrogenase [Spirochaetes bacterium]|nr:iron-containing alcohol dehydrogenase [Spirochaetota bacterium]
MQIPEHYEFFNQAKIISGAKALENIPSEFESLNAGKPLVVTGKKIDRSAIKKFVKAFYDSKMTLGGIYDEVRDYAGITLARDAAHLAKERGCDCIIALGNGPIVDVAKAANILLSNKSENLFQYIDGNTVISRPLKPMIYVPVGSPSGMEPTNTVTVDHRRLESDFLYPDIIIIDPRMARGRCRQCAARSAVVALAQGVVGTVYQSNNPMIDAYVYASLQFIADNMATAIKKPSHKNAAMAMINASVFAAIAYSNTVPGVVQLLADEMSKSTDIEEGAFIRILLPHALAYLMHKKFEVPDRLYLALAGEDAYSAAPAKERSVRGVNMVLQLLALTGDILPASLKALKIPRHKLPEYAGIASEKSGKRFTKADCMAILNNAWE